MLCIVCVHSGGSNIVALRVRWTSWLLASVLHQGVSAHCSLSETSFWICQNGASESLNCGCFHIEQQDFWFNFED